MAINADIFFAWTFKTFCYQPRDPLFQFFVWKICVKGAKSYV